MDSFSKWFTYRETNSAALGYKFVVTTCTPMHALVLWQSPTFSVLTGDRNAVAIREELGSHSCAKSLIRHLQKYMK